MSKLQQEMINSATASGPVADPDNLYRMVNKDPHRRGRASCKTCAAIAAFLGRSFWCVEVVANVPGEVRREIMAQDTVSDAVIDDAFDEAQAVDGAEAMKKIESIRNDVDSHGVIRRDVGGLIERHSLRPGDSFTDTIDALTNSITDQFSPLSYSKQQAVRLLKQVKIFLEANP